MQNIKHYGQIYTFGQKSQYRKIVIEKPGGGIAILHLVYKRLFDIDISQFSETELDKQITEIEANNIENNEKKFEVKSNT